MSASRAGGFRAWAWVVLLAVVAASLAVAAAGDGGARTPEDRARAVARGIRCPVCRGESVLESQSPTARAIRVEIRQRIEAGDSDDEIADLLVASYGREILLTPPRSGLAGLVWVLPVAALVVALGGLVLAFRRWRGELAAAGAHPPSPADEALVAAARARAESSS